MRNILIVLALCLLAGASLADVPKAFDIAAQPLSRALLEFSRQADLIVTAPTDLVKGKAAPAVRGDMEPMAALAKLLEGSGLNAVRTASGGITVGRLTSDTQSDEAMRLARSEAPLAKATAENPPPAADGAAGGEISEIIVTAQKREERLQDVPIPVTVIDTQSLVNSNQVRLQDYYAKIPGLNLTILGDASGPVISIRGVTTGGFVNTTTGVVVDDIPFGASIFSGFGGSPATTPDVDPSELSRIEVLRGPQGTLYGASSMGGLLKYVTVDPSTERVSGRVQVGSTGVHKSDDFGYSVRGSINIPVSETFAVRAGGSTRSDPGYIDNLQTGQQDLNKTDSESARVAALWRPSEDLLMKFSALYQHSERGGAPDVHLPSAAGLQTAAASGRPDLGEFQQTALIDTGWYDQKFQAYSLTLGAKLGRAELSALSGYNISEIDSSTDQTPALRARTITQFAVTGAVQSTHSEVSKFSQELRLSTPLGDRVDWLFGAFYTRERYPAVVDLLAIDANTGAVAGSWQRGDALGSYAEYAAFTDLTFQITDRFDLQVGARQSYNKVTSESITVGPFNTVFSGFPSQTVILPQTAAKDDALTYLLTPRWRISPDLMVYGRVASGYRPGGPNSGTARAAGFPFEYEHDTTVNYELGLKGNAFERMLSFDASVYYIDWADLQVQLRQSNTSPAYNANAGSAKSEGVELSVELKPADGLTICAWGAYNNAVLTSVPPVTLLTAVKGDRLPYAVRKSGALAVDREFPLGALAGSVGASVSYVGDRKGRFFTGFPQGTFPAYKQLDLRAGASLNAWTIGAFVNNATDERGVLRNGRDSLGSALYASTYIQPRTFGLSLTRTF